MSSKVYFTDMTTGSRNNLLNKTRGLAEKAGLDNLIEKNDLVAIKVHFGEVGNIAYIPSPLIRIIVEMVKEKGGKPFLTDTNTLYNGKMRNAVDHLETATKNGFSFSTIGAPVIIADGLKGADYFDVAVEGKHFKSVKIGSAIHYANVIIAISHVKGHELFGFGGAMKNLGMGCGSPAGKQAMHSDLVPCVNEEKCTACGICIDRCPEKAIVRVKNDKAFVQEELCVGCGECVPFCPAQAIPINWKTDLSVIQEKTAEYAYGAVKPKKGKSGFLNYIMNVSPDCDCYSWNDLPIVPNLGILASLDPVAIDQASLDLINDAPVIANSILGGKEEIKDKFKAVHNKETTHILTHGEYLGMGSREYNLESVWLNQNRK